MKPTGAATILLVVLSSPVAAGDMVPSALESLEKLGARLIGVDGKPAAGRPVAGVLFPRIGCNITDDDLRHLNSIPTLNHAFILGQKKVTGAGLKYLSGHPRLSIFDFDGTPIQSKYLVHLKDMKQLHKLGLWRTAIDDEGMAHLKGLDKLEHLYLSKTKVSDEGIESLGKHPSLCNVQTEGSRVTANGIAWMKKNFPRYGLEPLRGD